MQPYIGKNGGRTENGRQKGKEAARGRGDAK